MHNPYAGVLRVTQTWADHVANGGSPGVDFGADVGTPIIAPCDGILHFFDNGSAGFDAVIYQADGSAERACHNMDNSLGRALHMTRVYEGQHVSYSGNTGDVVPRPTPWNPNAGAHIHANGWSRTGLRIPPFGQSISSAGLDSIAFPGDAAAAVPVYSGEENTMYFRHTNGLVASLDTTRGFYRYLHGWELNALTEEEKGGRIFVHPLGSPEWENTFGPLTLVGTTELSDGTTVAVDDSNLDELAELIASKQPSLQQIVAQVIAAVDASDNDEHAALQMTLAALLARVDQLPDDVRKKLAAAIAD